MERHEHSTLALSRIALDRKRLFGGDSSIKASGKNATRTRPNKRGKVQRGKNSVDVEWFHGEKAQVVECQVVLNVDIYIQNSGR